MKKAIIILSGVYLLCVALLLCAVCVLGFVALHLKPAGAPQAASGAMLLLVYLPMAAWAAVTGICLMMKKGWARYSLYVMSAFALFIGLMMLAVFIFAPLPAASQAAAATMRVTSSAFSAVFFVAIPLFFLIFFTRRSVISEYGQGAVEAKAPSPRPLGVTLISIFFLFGGLMTPLYVFAAFFGQMPMQLGSMVLSGPVVRLWLLLSAALCCYIGIGLWRLMRHAWISAFVYQIILVVLAVVNVVMLSEATVQQLIAATSRISGQAQPVHMSLGYLRAMYCFSLLWPAAVLVYLWMRKSVFAKKTSAGAA